MQKKQQYLRGGLGRPGITTPKREFNRVRLTQLLYGDTGVARKSLWSWENSLPVATVRPGRLHRSLANEGERPLPTPVFYGYGLNARRVEGRNGAGEYPFLRNQVPVPVKGTTADCSCI